MKSSDIPQDATPRKIREALIALTSGALNAEELGEQTGLSKRHVHYHLQAARILGFVEKQRRWFVVTGLGDRWASEGLHTPRSFALFEYSVANSPYVTHLAPSLLDPTSPTVAKLAERIQLLTDLAAETALRRARTLLRYRLYALGGEPSLFPSSPAKVDLAASLKISTRSLARPLAAIHVQNYGCLREVHATLSPLTVVLGRNAAGKTTLFDALGFVADAFATNVKTALLRRASSLSELLWFGLGTSFTLAFDFAIPETLHFRSFRVARYELSVGSNGSSEACILSEVLFLKGAEPATAFGHANKTPRNWKRILSLSPKGTAYYHAERTAWKTVFNIGTNKLAISQLPDDPKRFAITTWVKSVIRRGVQRLELNSKRMREPTSPLLDATFLPDGSNLPKAAAELRRSDPGAYRDWVQHIGTAFPDVEDVLIRERPEDKHLYFSILYRGGLELPAWRLSDGTLRLLALTLIAYQPSADAIYLIEEPENGIHPQAIETVYQSLSSCYGSQVLVATHSPVFLGIVPPDDILLLQKRNGQTAVTRGCDHAVLSNWHHEVDLGTLFAAGVLT